MNTLTENIQIIRDRGGHPTFAVIPFAEYQALKSKQEKIEYYIPNTVVNFAMDNDWTPLRAWREHLKLTPTEVAGRLKVTPLDYEMLERQARLRKLWRKKIAKVLGIAPEQLDF